MRQTMRRIPIAIGLAGITVALIWGGYQVFDAGRDVMAQEARLRVEYFFGSHLFWLLAGVLVAAILEVDSEPTARRPITPTLMAAIVATGAADRHAEGLLRVRFSVAADLPLLFVKCP